MSKLKDRLSKKRVEMKSTKGMSQTNNSDTSRVPNSSGGSSLETARKMKSLNHQVSELQSQNQEYEKFVTELEEKIAIAEQRSLLSNDQEFRYQNLLLLQNISQALVGLSNNVSEGLNSINQQLYDLNQVLVTAHGLDDEEEVQESQEEDDDEDVVEEEVSQDDAGIFDDEEEER